GSFPGIIVPDPSPGRASARHPDHPPGGRSGSSTKFATNHEAVSLASLRFDRVLQAQLFQTAPQPRNVDRQRVVVDEIDVVPKGFQKLVTLDDLPVALGQGQKEAKLLGRELHLSALVVGAVSALVKPELARPKHLRFGADGVLAVSAPDDALHLGDGQL